MQMEEEKKNRVIQPMSMAYAMKEKNRVEFAEAGLLGMM